MKQRREKIEIRLLTIACLAFAGSSGVATDAVGEAVSWDDWDTGTESVLLSGRQNVFDLPLMLAEAPPDAEEEGAAPSSPECAAFAADPDADVGDIIRAGCQPTLAQMSALMDNPLGNVAMLFTQFDLSILENPAFER